MVLCGFILYQRVLVTLALKNVAIVVGTIIRIWYGSSTLIFVSQYAPVSAATNPNAPFSM